MRRRRGLWAVYRVCAVGVVSAMCWLTSDLSALERAQAESAAEAAHQQRLRLALWRMDSWLGPSLIAETTGPTLGHHVVQRFRLSPDRPAELLEISVARSSTDEETTVKDVRSALATIDLRDVLRRMDSTGLWEIYSRTVEPTLSNDYRQRLSANVASQAAAATGAPGAAPTDLGPLASVWAKAGGGSSLLVLLRREFKPQTDAGRLFDRGVIAYVVDWPELRRSLVAEVSDLLPEPVLRPWQDASADPESAFVLASAPIALESPRPTGAPLPAWTPTRITLAIAWFAIGASLVAVGVTLKRTVDLSDRRSRFASSVTHELRTPLTTFRLYSEMLADDMVTDPAQRRVYLDTLKSEANRLSTLVENVLAYARVEEGRMPLARERIAVGDLLSRAAPPLSRRAAECGMTLSVDAAPAAEEVVDVDAAVVGQILFNLVDNACKYSETSRAREISISVTVSGRVARIAVADHGPGIAPDRVRAAFTPFERAGRPAGDEIPGIGIGLALSRALARDLGGDLNYEDAPGGGARFVLTLLAEPPGRSRSFSADERTA